MFAAVRIVQQPVIIEFGILIKSLRSLNDCGHFSDLWSLDLYHERMNATSIEAAFKTVYECVNWFLLALES